MVTEPVEKSLVHPAGGLSGFTVGRQVLPTMPQDGVGERHGRPWTNERPWLDGDSVDEP